MTTPSIKLHPAPPGHGLTEGQIEQAALGSAHQAAREANAKPEALGAVAAIKTEFGISNQDGQDDFAVANELDGMFCGLDRVAATNRAQRAGFDLPRIRQIMLDYTNSAADLSDRALVAAFKDKLAADGLLVNYVAMPTLSASAATPFIAPLRSAPNCFKASASLPDSIKLLSFGRTDSTEGAIIFDESSAAVLPANQHKFGRERVPLDFEHNTVPGTEEYNRTREPREVAAYGAPHIVPGDGLYLVDLTWTPTGEATARNYEDISPAPFTDGERRVIGLHSAALTRAGAIYDLHLFSSAQSLAAQRPDRSQVRLKSAISAYRAQSGCDFHTAWNRLQQQMPGLFHSAAAPANPTPFSARIENSPVNISFFQLFAAQLGMPSGSTVGAVVGSISQVLNGSKGAAMKEIVRLQLANTLGLASGASGEDMIKALKEATNAAGLMDKNLPNPAALSARQTAAAKVVTLNAAIAELRRRTNWGFEEAFQNILATRRDLFS